MVIIRSTAIAQEVESSGRLKIAAAPDSGRVNEPWQWRLTVADGPAQENAPNGQSLTLHDPNTGNDKTLELAREKNLVTATMRSEVLESELVLDREEGELVVIYMHTGELAVDQHSLGPGDAAILSGTEHCRVQARPRADRAGFALIRLGSLVDAGLVWIP